MHPDEVDTGSGVIEHLLAGQCPEWAHLRPRPASSSGTDHALYRLGDDLVVRLPRIASAEGQGDKEHRWLPRLAPQLPLKVPVPVFRGTPDEGYPFSWSVYRWLDGVDADREAPSDPAAAATELGRFIRVLRDLDATNGPLPGPHNFHRGEPLAERDEDTRAAIDALAGDIDVPATMAVWDQSVHSPVWDRAPVWIHGDLMPGNLLIEDGRLSAVIDFGGLGIGDPACDVMAGWTCVNPAQRREFRTAVEVDDATWIRARGWALSVAAIALPYYRDTNRRLADIARRTLAAVLSDAGP